MRKPTRISILLVLSFLQVATSAHAERERREELSDAQQQAKETFSQGKAAMDIGDFKSAMVLFQKSLALHPASGTLVNLAICEEKLGNCERWPQGGPCSAGPSRRLPPWSCGEGKARQRSRLRLRGCRYRVRGRG